MCSSAERLLPNLTSELYFIIQLLTTPTSSSATKRLTPLIGENYGVCVSNRYMCIALSIDITVD